MVSLGETGPIVGDEELGDDLADTQGGIPDMEKYITTGEVDTNGSQKVVAKLLVSNAAAGSVIGKGGASIDQLQKSSKARIQLSRAGEFYPGQKGATVRNFMADSGATIRIQSLSDLSKDDSERIVTVYGARDKVLRAVALVLNALSMDPKYNAYMETTMQLAASQGLIGPVKTLVGRSPLAQARTTISLFIPDDDVGSILGKGGQSLVKMQQAAKVKITVSDRKLMDPKTREREVSISGTHPQVRLAEAMISEKIGQHRNQRQPMPGRELAPGEEEPLE